MRIVTSLSLPLALLLGAAPLAAQVADELAAELDALSADEREGEAEETLAVDPDVLAESSPEAVDDAEAEDETSAGKATDNPLMAKLAALAEDGNGEAAYHLGMAYHLGVNGAGKDAERALALFRQSAEAGDPLGAYMLGSYYEDGTGGVEPDAALALEHKLAAAEAGHALAQHDVARIFYGQGETEKALDYLLTSAKQGYRPSLEALASLHSGEGKVAKDPVKQFAYVALLQASSGEEPSERLQAWRDRMQAELSEEQLKQAMAIVGDWKVAPSDVTRKAFAGDAAAMELAGLDAAAPEPEANPEPPRTRDLPEGR